NARIIGAAGDPWELYVGNGGVLELRLLGRVMRGTHVVNDNQAHFVDAAWDGTLAALYVDGALDTQLAVSGVLASSAGGLMMGAHPTRGDYLSGRLQAVSLFDRALSAAQVADRYSWEMGQQTATSAVFAYNAAPSSTGTLRASAITFDTQAVAVTQAPMLDCTVSVTPTSLAVPSGGRSGFLAATTSGSHCSTILPTSNATWVTLGTP